jgi:large subunit ribosomal protein L15
MDLSNLKAPKGANRKRRRVGRGEGSTLGKTCGRGSKGQKSRSGGNIPATFEGGQMPLFRRLPKFGFTNPTTRTTGEVNVRTLERVFEEGDVVTIEELYERRVLRRPYDRVKILGAGELTKKLDVRADAFSKSAREKIEELGGTAEVIRRGE